MNTETIPLEKLKKISLLGERIRLVPFTLDHLNNPDYIKWLRDYEVVRYINRPEYLEGIGFEEVKTYVENRIVDKGNLFFAMEVIPQNKLIGTFRIADINWYSGNINLGILIGDRSYWGKGIATEAFALAIEFGFNQMKMHKIVGGCMEPNTGMKKVFEKLGFKQEGCFRDQDFLEGKHHDHVHYGLFKEEYEKIKK